MNIISQKEPLIIQQDDLVQAVQAENPVDALAELYWKTVRGTGLTRLDCQLYAEVHNAYGIRVNSDGYLPDINTSTNQRVRVVS